MSTDKLGRELLKTNKFSIKFTFWGGFAVDADFGDAFSGSIEGPQNPKKRYFYDFWAFNRAGKSVSKIGNYALPPSKSEIYENFIDF
jgi:hypothetical protein